MPSAITVVPSMTMQSARSRIDEAGPSTGSSAATILNPAAAPPAPRRRV